MNTTLTPKRSKVRDDWMTPLPTGPRCMLWVDGVGGYLTCLTSTVRIGQAVAGSGVEIPVMGDLSRHHATIKRQGEGYLIEPHGPTVVASRSIDGPRGLADGDEIRLGETVTFRFRQPHALSSSARIEFLSTHRTQPYADGIILMAGSCILGASSSSHIVCRHWEQDLVLVRQGQSLAAHVAGEFEVDGKPTQGRAALTLDSNVCGADFRLSLERIV